MRYRLVQAWFVIVSSVSCLFGATLSTRASCDVFALYQEVTGTSSASCSIPGDPGTYWPAAGATATSSPYSVFAQEIVDRPTTTPKGPSTSGPEASSTATYDENLTFTVVGNSGSGIILPLLSAYAGAGLNISTQADATASLGAASVTFVDGDGATPAYNYQYIPFTFGVPFTLRLHLEANVYRQTNYNSAYGSTSDAGFEGFGVAYLDNGQRTAFTLIQGVPAPNPIAGDPTAVPEPSTLLLAALGAGLLGSRKRLIPSARIG